MNILSGYKELEEKLGYCFKDKDLVNVALAHSSYINETKAKKSQCYERIEFLGDAVLELSVSEFLFQSFSEMPEGDMTKLRASLVCEPTLSYIARTELDLGKYILLGKGEENTGGRNRDSIISDVFEAIIGAVYLDGGFEIAKDIIKRFVLTDMNNKIEFVDSKTNLQEYAQNKGLSVRYELISENGPAHDREYVVSVYVGDEFLGEGKGRTKKSAEQHAAYAALVKAKESSLKEN